MDKIEGFIKIKKLHGSIVQIQNLCGEINAGGFTDCPVYQGDYEVIPKVEKQELKTAGFLMKENVKVHSVPIFYTSNSSDGNTVYIATEDIYGG